MTTAKFFAWNIDQARREESFPETTWDNRSPHVKNLVSRVNADIVALIEIRDLETSHENARQFLSSPQFQKYDVVSRRYCHFALAFHMALLVKPEKFFVGDVRVHNFSGNPENDKMVMFVDLQCKVTKKWFTIGVTHFDLPEDTKWQSCHILKHIVSRQAHPCLIYGDYNFFDDKEGTSQRNFMLESFDDLAYPLDGGKRGVLSGTFVGFPHDDFKQSEAKMSRLDHIFSPKTNGILGKAARSPHLDEFSLDNSSYVTYNYPSDHLALELDILIQ